MPVPGSSGPFPVYQEEKELQCEEPGDVDKMPSRGRVDLGHTREMVDWKVAGVGRGLQEAAQRSSRI